MTVLVEDFGFAKCPTNLGYLKLGLNWVSDKDISLKEACFKLFLAVHKYVGEAGMQGILQQVPDQQRGALQKKISSISIKQRTI